MEVETERLVLVPVGPDHGADLVRLHRDPWVAYWYGGSWSPEEAAGFASACADGWRRDGVSKWMAYDRVTGDLVGRGGLTRMPSSSTAARQIDALLGDPSWWAGRLELGWAVRGDYRGRGLAPEIGRAGLTFAGGTLGSDRVIAFTERHNLASRRVMEKLGLAFAGEIAWRGLVQGGDEERDDAPFAVYRTTA